jgi:peptidoglycan hydrolase CwlO-like protein
MTNSPYKAMSDTLEEAADAIEQLEKQVAADAAEIERLKILLIAADEIADGYFKEIKKTSREMERLRDQIAVLRELRDCDRREIQRLHSKLGD